MSLHKLPFKHTVVSVYLCHLQQWLKCYSMMNGGDSNSKILNTRISKIINVRGVHAKGNIEALFVIFDVVDGIDDRWCGVNGVRLGVTYRQYKRTKFNIIDGSHGHVILII